MFKVCGLIGISDMEFFSFSSTERVKYRPLHRQYQFIFLIVKLPKFHFYQLPKNFHSFKCFIFNIKLIMSTNRAILRNYFQIKFT